MFFICPIFEDTRTESENANYLSLLNQLLPFLWAKYPTDFGKIHSIPPIKTKTDPSKSLSSKQRNPSKHRAHKDYKAQGLIISCTNFCKTLILPMRRKSKGQD